MEKKTESADIALETSDVENKCHARMMRFYFQFQSTTYQQDQSPFNPFLGPVFRINPFFGLTYIYESYPKNPFHSTFMVGYRRKRTLVYKFNSCRIKIPLVGINQMRAHVYIWLYYDYYYYYR